VQNPNAVVQLAYPDGSVALLTYTTLGHPGMGKEYIEVFGSGRSGYCNDYQDFGVFGGEARKGKFPPGDKGQLGALEEFADAIQGRSRENPGADALAGVYATWAALAAHESGQAGRVVGFDEASA
jgi:hypothetical protein